jgi:hypothetical protein
MCDIPADIYDDPVWPDGIIVSVLAATIMVAVDEINYVSGMRSYVRDLCCHGLMSKARNMNRSARTTKASWLCGPSRSWPTLVSEGR